MNVFTYQYQQLFTFILLLMSVIVGVRVRPFNKREEQLGSRLCVQMEGKTTSLVDGEGKKKDFHYDYSFWSHDGFRVDEEGYSHPVNDKYADQKRVYDLIGASILTNAWEGYNCCLFAYGQTGSGKSYSMIGYGVNKGLIPIVCNSIFEKIQNNQDGTRSFEVKISMLQIYNEAVRDLLSKSKKQELKICEHKTLGVYVDGLEKHSVDSYEKIQKKIEEGSNNRSIAATLMNESSSRSHTIVTINFIQKIQISMEQTSVKYSMIHLVDLAGSQCVAKTGVDSKDRLRETAKINQSLTTLGRVIEILADNCNKKQKDKTFVPYRDSKLTLILRSALGGNSCTAMICAISPSDDNYEQTLSTLRYASRAKKIQNKAIVNESDVDKLIRLLREQNEMLKKMLQQAKTNRVAVNEQMISNFNQTKKMVDLAVEDNNKSKEEEFLLALEDNQDNNSSMTNDSFSISPIPSNVNQNLPYLTNLSQDEQLRFRIKYSCEKLYIGNKKGNPKPDVVLTSLGIQPNHAFISYESQSKKCFIELLDQNAVNYTFINGQTVSTKAKEEIFHLDRIIFGTGCIFILQFQGSTPRNPQLTLNDIDYQFAMNELQNSTGDRSSPGEDKSLIEEQQLRKKIICEIEEDFMNVKKQKQEQMKRQIQQKQSQYFSKIKQLQECKEKEAKQLLQQLQKRKQQSQRLEHQKYLIKQQVQQIINETKERARRDEIEKKQLQQAKRIVQLKEKQIQELQQKMEVIKVQTQNRKIIAQEEIKKQEEQIKQELQLQRVICHNANIIDEYHLQVKKRAQTAEEQKDLLYKRERIELQKQLVELVPQIERFNLMAKQMNKKIECGLSIEYKYISDAQIIEIGKNQASKLKLKILIHVINREQGRSYYWDTAIFKNRFDITLQTFDNYIKYGDTIKTKEQDPYWDPQRFQAIAYTHISLQFIMYNISFSGDISIVSHGKKMGKMKAKLYQTDYKGNENIALDCKANSEYKLVNPYEYILKTLYFVLQFSDIELNEQMQEFDQMKLKYSLLDNYKMVCFETDVIPKIKLPSFKYKKMHILKQLSEATIMHYLEKPLAIEMQAIIRVTTSDQLTHRSSFTSNTNIKSSFASQAEQITSQIQQPQEVTQFIQISPPRKSLKIPVVNLATNRGSPSLPIGAIYENTEITKKVQQQYRLKKEEELNSQAVNMKKNKGSKSVLEEGKNSKQCQIY